MKKSILLLVPLLLTALFATVMSSCKRTFYSYSYKLMPDSINLSKDTLTNAFEDNIISASFSIGYSRLAFTINNLTNESLKINWDEASLVQEGKSKRVIHNGIKLIDRNVPQAPSVIPPKMSYSDFVIPSDNCYYFEGISNSTIYIPPRWMELPLYPVLDSNSESQKNLILNNKGKVIILYLPLERNGSKINYMFKFKISNVSPVKS